MYGTSKIRLATGVGEVPGRSGATCKAVLHPGVLGSVAITEDRGCRRVLPDWIGIRASGSVTVLKSIFPIRFCRNNKKYGAKWL